MEPLEAWRTSWRPMEAEGLGSRLRSTLYLIFCPQQKTGDTQVCSGNSLKHRLPPTGASGAGGAL